MSPPGGAQAGQHGHQRARDGRFDNQRPGQAVDRHREERREEAACQRRDERLHMEFIHQQRHPLNQQPNEECCHHVPQVTAAMSAVLLAVGALAGTAFLRLLTGGAA